MKNLFCGLGVAVVLSGLSFSGGAAPFDEAVNAQPGVAFCSGYLAQTSPGDGAIRTQCEALVDAAVFAQAEKVMSSPSFTCATAGVVASFAPVLKTR